MNIYRLLLLTVVFFEISGCEEALQKSLSDKSVSLIAPGNSVSTTSPVNFAWEQVEAAEHYRIQIMSPDFGPSQILVIDSSITRLVVSLPLEPGKYEWRVQAINSSSVSKESDSRSLTIE